MRKIRESWATAPFVWSVWGSYGLICVLVQLTGYSTLTLDFAVSAEVMQRQFALGYQLRNPPAYEWLLWLVQLALGPGILSHLVLRYTIIALLGVSTYFAIRQIHSPPSIAAAISFSMVTFFWFGWDFQFRVTHTLPLLLAGLVSWMLLLEQIERPGFANAFKFGLAIGIGLVSKYNFVIFIAGLAVALSLCHRTRCIFRDPRMLLAPIGALLPCAPFILWLLNIDSSVVQLFQKNLIVTAEPHMVRVGAGLLKLAESTASYFLPWALLIAFLVWRYRRPVVAEDTETDWRGRLALMVTGATLALTVLGILVLGADHMPARYLYPMFLVTPIGVAAWLTPRVDCSKFAQLLAILALILAVLALIVRAGSFHIQDFPKPKKDTHLIPYAALAEALVARGLGEADIVTLSPRDAGNLIALLPDARVLSLRTRRLQPPPLETGPRPECVALWGDRYRMASEPPGELVVPDVYGRRIVQNMERWTDSLDVRWRRPLIGGQRVTTWHMLGGPAVRAICRVAAGTSSD